MATKNNNYSNRNLVLFVGSVLKGNIKTIQELKTKTQKKYRIGLLYNPKKKNIAHQTLSSIDVILTCNFDNPESIKQALKSHKKDICAVTARSEKNIPHFQKTIPHLPKRLLLPNPKALEASTNKVIMRKLFEKYAKEISPSSVKVVDNKKNTIDTIKRKIGFPLIVKPAGLASSLLVSICYDTEELKTTLQHIFKIINQTYVMCEGRGTPAVLVEEYMDGDIFSTDVYISKQNKMYFCPFVHARNGRSVGFDDFFEYALEAPTILAEHSQKKAQEVAKKGIQALGLRNSSAHVELMRTNEGWKIIEIGPRIGGFRQMMYWTAFNFNHSKNDILIRMGEEPIIYNKTKQYITVMKFFPEYEGYITSLKGVKKAQDLKSVSHMKVRMKVGDYSNHAKNGGEAPIRVILSNKVKSLLLADVRRLEQMITIETISKKII